jgi:hypothetical protein
VAGTRPQVPIRSEPGAGEDASGAARLEADDRVVVVVGGVGWSVARYRPGTASSVSTEYAE